MRGLDQELLRAGNLKAKVTVMVTLRQNDTAKASMKQAREDLKLGRELTLDE